MVWGATNKRVHLEDYQNKLPSDSCHFFLASYYTNINETYKLVAIGRFDLVGISYDHLNLATNWRFHFNSIISFPTNGNQLLHKHSNETHFKSVAIGWLSWNRTNVLSTDRPGASPGRPFCIIRAAVFMVSPKSRKRGSLLSGDFGASDG